MPKSRSRPSSFSSAQNLVLPRECFARISAIEGIALTAEMRATLERFDREGLSAAERRRTIISHYAPTH